MDLPGIALDLLFPRDCVVCGERLAPSPAARYPICPACVSSLRPIAGRRCPRCGKNLISEEGLCMDCRGKVFACGEVLPLFVYESEAATLISAYKSRKRWSLAGFWADFIAVELRDRWPGCVVVPVPPRPEKRKAGQADQVELLARALVARGFRIERLLTRGASEQQKSLGREGRKVNSKAAYSLAPGVAVPREVVILDDVYTTGATVEACASALKAGGAAVVRAVVLAAD